MIKDIYADVAGQSEDALQQKCCFWFWNEYPHLRLLLFSVPNGGTRDKREVKKLKATGLTPGVSDLILLFKGVAYLIELKKDKFANQSGNQIDWQEAVSAQGFTYFIIRSLIDFKLLIKTIIL